jgi:hypothetical protein
LLTPYFGQIFFHWTRCLLSCQFFDDFSLRKTQKPQNWSSCRYLKLALALLIFLRLVSHDGLPNLKGGASVNQSNPKDPKKGMPTGKPAAAPSPAKPQPFPAKKPIGR